MEQNISYSLILTKDQADFLSASKQGINRMRALVSLINLTRTAEGTYEKKGFSATVHVGQFVASEVEIHTLLCVASWYIDGRSVRNGFYKRLSDRSSGNTNEGKGRMG